ncbi:hypothetical protein J5N97_000851 [Dioscorea zingiberensis]|uniref:Uncharacterized protein n=1 Tax=Dioscorea zingiberensis TaxID=325984 RepID=A0A9D5BUW6_9LILI|nr:hypothetical protein J5N97_000851 [Dioscorea zingiberensis]
MALSLSSVSSSLQCIVLLLISCNSANSVGANSVPMNEKDMVQFALNLEFLEAEFFLNSALGRGLDEVAPGLAMGGPPPVGAQRAALSDPIDDIIIQFAYQEVGHLSMQLVAGLLAVEAGQDAVIRTLLYQRKDELVEPYNMTIAEFTNRISELRNRLASTGVKDEGLTVRENLGAENETTNNIISADVNSLGYARTQVETLRTLYGTGNEAIPGGFFPHGANGRIASANSVGANLSMNEKDMVQFALNLEFLEAEFFLNSALSRGLDDVHGRSSARRGLLSVIQLMILSFNLLIRKSVT